MKLGSFFILLAGIAQAANFSKCPTIEPAENEKSKGPACDEAICVRQCKNGFEPVKPKKVTCIKKTNGKFKWDDELGGCEAADAETTDDKPTDDKPTEDKPTEDKPTEDKPISEDNPGCKEVEMKNSQIKTGMTVSYKVNGKGQFLATMACKEGMTVNGKEGVDKKKLVCKCNKKSGKCKWKNEKNKKISKATYQKWKCEGDATEADKPTDDKPTDDKPTDGDYNDKPDWDGEDWDGDKPDWDGEDWGDKPDGDDTTDGKPTTGGGDQPPATTLAPAADGVRRVLALHGGGGSGANMPNELGVQDLMDAVGDQFEFVFPSAPGGLWMRDPPGKDEPTTDPAWADETLNYLDQFIADNGPFWAMMGYSQGSAFIPVYLSNRPEAQFDRVMMYNGYTPTTHEGLMATLNANAPLATRAMVFSGENDVFAFGAPDQVAVFSDVVHYHSQTADHHLPTSNDGQFQNTVDFFLAP
jgi:hypothetical protein